MNLLLKMAQKACLVGALIMLWLLDDIVPFLPDRAVWGIIGMYLTAVGRSDRLGPLKEFWLGDDDDGPPE